MISRSQSSHTIIALKTPAKNKKPWLRRNCTAKASVFLLFLITMSNNQPQAAPKQVLRL
jgi:hypothetical protein